MNAHNPTKLAGPVIPLAGSATPIGASCEAMIGGCRPTGAAGAPSCSTPKVTCPECDGSGECEFIALDSVRYETGYCETCDGEGLVAPFCGTCEGPLTGNGFCTSCDDFCLTALIARDLGSEVAL